jgi:hypothetical protein
MKMMKLASIALGTAMACLAPSVSLASVATFGQFTQVAAGNDFKFTSKNVSADFVAATHVSFTFSNIPGLTADLTGPQDATLTLTAHTTTAVTSIGTNRRQRFDSFLLQITRNTPTQDGKTNLLTIDLTPAAINGAKAALSGTNGSGAATLSGGTGAGLTVLFTSDYLDFTGTLLRDIALSFTSITPSYAKGTGAGANFLKSFTAAGTGTFSTDAPPTFIPPVPEPASMAVLLVGGGLLMGRRVRR